MQEYDPYLAPFTTFGIHASAERIVSAESHDDLVKIFTEEPSARILGGGSNVLLSDDVNGTVVLMRIMGRTTVREDDNHIWVRFGAGETWHDVVTWTVHNGWGGIENLALIPGTVGAAPMQNIGAYGVEQNSVFDSLTAYDRKTHEELTYSASACAFGYRDSIFKHAMKNRAIITSVTYRLSKHPIVNASYADVRAELETMSVAAPSIKDIYTAVVAIRKRKLPNPADIGNAGSFFKNPVVSRDVYTTLKSHHAELAAYAQHDGSYKLAAAWLIDQCGWKGHRRGDAGVHERQALVLVNYGTATGAEILQIADEIQESVRERFGVELEREVNVW